MIKTPPISNMQNAFSVAGKNVVVTGGNRGVGLGISTAFAQSGANVAILCRNVESGKQVADDLKQYGGKYACFECDVSKTDSVKAAAQSVFDFFGNVDVLVNNAGIAANTEFLSDADMCEWHDVIDTNLHGVANVVHAIAPNMRDAGRGGSIINISSMFGFRVSSASKGHHTPPYNAAKAGLNMFTRYLCIDLGDYGIRVNAIAPGYVHSDLDKDLPPETLQSIENTMPTHRFGEPIEIGALCVFLASPAACQITGVVIIHDGGMVNVE